MAGTAGALASCGFIAGIEDLQPVPGDASTDGVVTAADAPATADVADAPSGRDAPSSPDAPSDVSDAGPADVLVACDAGIVCDGACVDPATDPANCNGCGNVCTTGMCGTSIVADMTTPPSLWQFNGSAQYDKSAPSGELTVANVTLQAGTMNYTHPVAVDAFGATFQFRMGLQGGTRSDGMGFMFQRTGPGALGANGGALGMVGLDGYGVELDIFDNGACGEPSSDHVGVDSLLLCDPNDNLPTSYGTTDLTGMIDLADASWHSADVELVSGAITVSIDGTTVATSVPLTGLQAGTPYYFGFGAATGELVTADGGGGYRMEVKDVAIKFPTPRCL